MFQYLIKVYQRSNNLLRECPTEHGSFCGLSKKQTIFFTKLVLDGFFGKDESLLPGSLIARFLMSNSFCDVSCFREFLDKHSVTIKREIVA